MPGGNSGSGARADLGLLFGALLGLWIVMALLGRFFVTTFRASAIKHEGISGGLLVEGFLAPPARKLLDGSTLPAESRADLSAALDLQPLRGKIIAFKLWDLKGRLIFASDGTVGDAHQFPVGELEKHGADPVAEFHPEGKADEKLLVGRPVVEVYAPIFDAERKKVIAIGEFYGNADDFRNLLRRTGLTIWLAVAMTTFGLTGCLFLLAARQRDLVQNLDATRKHAAQNLVLKDYADQARLQDSQTHEELLNHLGAELHDGPVQLLTLLMLMPGRDKTAELESRGLSSQVII